MEPLSGGSRSPQIFRKRDIQYFWKRTKRRDRMRKIFGTDGVRGTANLYPMTSEVALAMGRAIAYLARKRSKRPKIIVGKDTRISGYMIEMALVSGICSMGADALMTGPIPTPGIAYLTVDMRCDAGIMITASHNQYEDNGLKIFGPDGFKLTDKEQEEIESHIIKHYTTAQLISPDDDSYPVRELIGKAKKIEDARGRYIAHVKSAFPKERDLVGLKIAVDCANGAAYKIAPEVFEELGAEVIVIGDEPNGTNINDMCGATSPHSLAMTVQSWGCDIGIALDGDADRLVVVDETGAVVHGDVLLALASWHGKEEDHAFVTTTMSGLALKEYIEQMDLTGDGHDTDLLVTDVGDRYVTDAMRKYNISVGGEQSGHIIYLDHSTTGDGMVAALKLLDTLVFERKTMSDLAKVITPYPQVLINVPVVKKTPFREVPELQKITDDTNKLLGDKGRVLVRYSGTENKLRVMVECKDEQMAITLAEGIADVAREVL